jgi:sugar-specific transcriptional regulator TrmB
VDKEKLIGELKDLGFNEYKAKVFLSLSKGKLMTASEIAKDAKIVRGSIYDILKDFVEKGYCNQIETNRILQFQIIDPEVIVDKIERDYRKDFNLKVTNLKGTFSKVKDLYSSEHPDESKYINIELIRGYNKHRVAKYRDFLVKAQKEICGIYQLKGIISDDSDKVANEFIQKGGKIRSIYSCNLDFKMIKEGDVIDATKNDLIKVCRNFESMGEEVRISGLNMPNMTVVDHENVFINTDDKWIPRQNQADIILRRSGLAGNLYDLFNYYWNDSFTINEFEKMEGINNQ